MPNAFQKIFALFSPKEKRLVYIVLLVMLVMAILDVVGVASIMPFMSLVANQANMEHSSKLLAVYHALHFHNSRDFLLFLGFIVLGILLLGNVYTIFTTWFIMKFASLRQYHLAKRLLECYLARPYEYFLDQNSAKLCSNIITEITVVISEYFVPALQLVAKLIVIILMLILLFWVNFFLAVTSIIFLGGAYSAIYMLTRKKLAQVSSAHVKNNQERYKIVSEAFGGIKDIKLLHREKNFIDQFSIPSREYADHLALYSTVALVPRYALETIAFSGVLLIVIYFLFTQKDISNVMPMLALYAFACFRLMPALQNIFSSITYMRVSKGAIDVIYQALISYPNTTLFEYPQETNVLNFSKEFSLNKITFTYAGTTTPIINNLTLTIPVRSMLAFVGVTGSGKTTIIDIILGLLRPQSGFLSVDGITLNNKNIGEWQKKLGYVPQAIFLADDTITNNIAFGIPDNEINQHAVIEAAKIANIHDFIVNELPSGYDTVIGERGIRLSGGQRQRIGIARAMYNDPEVLVLDEATSALDGKTESMIMDAVHTLSHKKTIIIIAHRISTIKECDLIYLFGQGKITKIDNYMNLMDPKVGLNAMENIT